MRIGNVLARCRRTWQHRELRYLVMLKSITISVTGILDTHMSNTLATERQAWRAGPPSTHRISRSREVLWSAVETYLQPMFPRAFVRQRNTISRGQEMVSNALPSMLSPPLPLWSWWRAERRIALGACGPAPHPPAFMTLDGLFAGTLGNSHLCLSLCSSRSSR